MLGYINPFNSEYHSRWSFMYFMNWFWTLLALYFSYKCNVHEMMVLRILYMIVTYMFAPYYLIYYAVYHGIMRRPCANPFGATGVTYR